MIFIHLFRESNEIMKSVQNLNRFCVSKEILVKMKDFVKHVQGTYTCTMYMYENISLVLLHIHCTLYAFAHFSFIAI